MFKEKIKQNTLFGFSPPSKVDNIYGFAVLSVSRTKLRERGERMGGGMIPALAFKVLIPVYTSPLKFHNSYE